MEQISDEDFFALCKHMEKKFGIDLRSKKLLVTSRLYSAAKEEGFQDFHKYIRYILSTESRQSIITLLNHLTTNITSFFREKEHFEYLHETVFPELKKYNIKSNSISLWSAGCSTREEEFSISINAQESFKI